MLKNKIKCVIIIIDYSPEVNSAERRIINTKKKYVYLIGASFIIMAVICMFFWKTTETTKTYIGINGQVITVSGHFSSAFNAKPSTEQEIHKVGDLIRNEDGTEEVVCAISADGSGSFMTTSVEDYKQMIDSINNEEY